MQPSHLKIVTPENSEIELSLGVVQPGENKQSSVTINGHVYHLEAQGTSPALTLFHSKLESPP